MRAKLRGVTKLVALWLVLVFGQALGGALVFHGTAPTPADGPFDAARALLVVGAIDAMILFLLASASRLRGGWLGASLGLVLFGVQTAMSLVEAILFAADVHMPVAVLLKGAEVSLLRAALVGLAAAGLWRTRREPFAPARRVGGLTWKLPAVTAIYVTCYLAAGMGIAWRSAAVRSFYAHIDQIGLPALALLQIGRGLIWSGFACLLARDLTGPRVQVAGLTALAFSGLMAPQLLYPNAAMPWTVRSAHLLELGVSNLVFGGLAALVLLLRAHDTTGHGSEIRRR